MDTRHLRWARTFASLIAYTQERDELQPTDLVAGISTACFERIARYCATPDLLEDFVAEHCGWSEPRWLTWQRRQHEVLHPPFRLHIPFTSGWFELISFMGKKRRHFFGRMFKPSAKWAKLFKLGEQLAPHHVKWEGVMLPLLTKLVGFDYRATHFTGAIVVAALRASHGSVNAFPMQQMIQVFGGLLVRDGNAALRVVAEFILRLSVEPLLPETKCVATKALLSPFPDDAITKEQLRSFRNQIARLMTLNPLGQSDFQQCFDEWSREKRFQVIDSTRHV